MARAVFWGVHVSDDRFNKMKLNLASHGDNIPGFINIDFDHPSADLKADVTSLPFQDNSIDHILAYHILEHFRAGHYESHLSNPLNTKTVKEALLEWKRVLVPGGRLEIKVPDFDRIVWLYYNFPQWSRQRGVNDPFPHYTDWLVSNGQHQAVFDRITMEILLNELGFANIQFLSTPPKAIVNRENLELYVVCQK